MPNNSALFPDSAPPAGDEDLLFGRTSNRSLGGNLHDLPDTQITKLLHLKFDNNPITLIRQLSKDLTLKERELILLRKEKFAREQLLLKLLNEYGNLSSLEIDKKLNTISIDNNVDNVLHDMIEKAMEDTLEPVMEGSSSQKSRKESALSSKEKMQMKDRKTVRHHSRSSTPTRSFSNSSSAGDATLPGTSSSNKSSSWLNNWFNNGSHENLSSSGQTTITPTTRPHSNSFPISIGGFGSSASLTSHSNGNSQSIGGVKGVISSNDNDENSSSSSNNLLSINSSFARKNDTSSRVPVELDSIHVKTSDDISPPVSSTSIDKYGFFNDITKVMPKDDASNVELTNSTSSRSVHAPEPSFTGALIDSDLLVVEPKQFTSTLVETNDLEVSGTYSSNSNSKQSTTLDTLKQLSKMHDEKSKQYEDEWDNFFKSLLKYYYNHEGSSKNKPQSDHSDITTPFNHTIYSSANEIFGLRGLNLIRLDKLDLKQQAQIAVSSGQSHLESSLSGSYFKRLHKLIQKIGIPPQYRSQLWFELSGAKNLKVPGEYNRLYTLAISSTDDPLIVSNINQVKLDLHRTMPSNIYFNDVINSQPGPNYYRLQKILYAFVAYKPNIGYCQGMNKIISNLLLGGGVTASAASSQSVLSEDDIFWIFVSFIDELLPTYSKNSYNFFDNRSLAYIGSDQIILSEEYFPRFMPQLVTHFKKHNVQIEYIALNWWVSIFTENCLPIEIWIKFFDNMLVSQNVEILFFSMSLALFKNFEKLLLTLNSADDIYLIMKNLNQNNSTKSNLKYSELMVIAKNFEKKIEVGELEKFRQKYYTNQ